MAVDFKKAGSIPNSRRRSHNGRAHTPVKTQRTKVVEVVDEQPADLTTEAKDQAQPAERTALLSGVEVKLPIYSSRQ